MRAPITIAIVLALLAAAAMAALNFMAPRVQVLLIPGGNGCTIFKPGPTPFMRSRPCKDVARYLREDMKLAAGSSVRVFIDSRVPTAYVRALRNQLLGSWYIPMPEWQDVVTVASTRRPAMAVLPPAVDRGMVVPAPDVGR